MNLASIIKDSEYNLSLFSEEYIKELENKTHIVSDTP